MILGHENDLFQRYLKENYNVNYFLLIGNIHKANNCKDFQENHGF